MTADVSVVIPCFNSSAHLKRAFSSVMEQSIKPNEIILVDDGSTDNGKTRALIKTLAHRYKNSNYPQITTIFLDRNVGPGAARNAGWDAAKSELVAFLDSDDAWHPQKLEVQYRWMMQNLCLSASGHLTQLKLGSAKNAHNDFIGDADCATAYRIQVNTLLFRNVVQTRTVMIRSNIRERFPSELRYSEDYSLWLSLLTNGHQFGVIELPLAFSFRPEFSPGGHSAKLWEMQKAEMSIYLSLFRTQKINAFTALAAITFSFMKYFRRTFLRATSLLTSKAN